jgi:hypothetical protein
MRPERTGENRDRHREQHPPDREFGAEDRQFPRDRAAIADQRPAHHHRNGRTEIGTDGEQRRRHRISRERSARQDRAEGGADQKALEAGLRPERPRDFFMRQDFGNESAKQASRPARAAGFRRTAPDRHRGFPVTPWTPSRRQTSTTLTATSTAMKIIDQPIGLRILRGASADSSAGIFGGICQVSRVGR